MFQVKKIILDNHQQETALEDTLKLLLHTCRLNVDIILKVF